MHEPEPTLDPAPSGGAHLDDPCSWSDSQLLQCVLTTSDRNAPGRRRWTEVLDQSGGIGPLSGASPPLLRIWGLTPIETQHWQSVVELARRLHRQGVVRRPLDARSLGRLFRARIGHLSTEDLYVVLLDPLHRFCGELLVARGGERGCGISISTILRAVLRTEHGRFVLIHNHPSGSVSPSEEDVRLTSEVAESAQRVGLRLVDHLIVTRDACVSVLHPASRWLG